MYLCLFFPSIFRRHNAREKGRSPTKAQEEAFPQFWQIK